jgi:hypothetical protein
MLSEKKQDMPVWSGVELFEERGIVSLSIIPNSFQ